MTLMIDKRMDGARILWRPWLRPNDEAREGFVREFSPTGAQVRISDTAAANDHGVWYEAARQRCIEVLDEHFDFEKFQEEEKKKRRRPREDGDEWKDCA